MQFEDLLFPLSSFFSSFSSEFLFFLFVPADFFFLSVWFCFFFFVFFVFVFFLSFREKEHAAVNGCGRSMAPKALGRKKKWGKKSTGPSGAFGEWKATEGCGSEATTFQPINCEHYFVGGTIVNRICGVHKNQHIYLFFLTLFGPTYYGPP